MIMVGLWQVEVGKISTERTDEQKNYGGSW